MGYMTAPPALVDLDGDGDVDGVLRRIKDGTGITMTLSNNILTINASGGSSQLTDGAPNNSNGDNGDVNIDYTNGDIYRKASNAWSLIETIPSMRRLRMFTAAYNTSTWSAGKFGIYSEKYYFYKTLFPGCASVSDVNTYLTNLNFTAGTRFVFQQIDNHDNIAVYRATESEVYIDGEGGYETGTIGSDHIGLVLTKESGVSFSSATYNVHITQPVNFVFDSSGNATIDADLAIKDMLVTTANGSSSSTAITTIDTWPIATYRSAKYEYQITDTGASPDEYQTGEIMLLHDGSNSKYNDYGVIFTGNSPLGTFSTDVYSGDCRLRFTATSSNAMAIKVAKKIIKL
jgi:hypothetical protein